MSLLGMRVLSPSGKRERILGKKMVFDNTKIEFGISSYHPSYWEKYSRDDYGDSGWTFLPVDSIGCIFTAFIHLKTTLEHELRSVGEMKRRDESKMGLDDMSHFTNPNDLAFGNKIFKLMKSVLKGKEVTISDLKTVNIVRLNDEGKYRHFFTFRYVPPYAPVSIDGYIYHKLSYSGYMSIDYRITS